MATPIPVARVSAISGEVFARDQDGVSRPLHAGDFIFDNEVVVTGENASVDLANMDGQPFNLGAHETLTMDAEVLAQDESNAGDSAVQVSGDEFSRIVAALNEGQSLDNLLEETAAGVAAAGGDAGGGPTFVRLLRITESVDPLNYEFETVRTDVLEYPINGGGQDPNAGGEDPMNPGPGGGGDVPPPQPPLPPSHANPALTLPDASRDHGYAAPEDGEVSGVFTIQTHAGFDESSALTINGQDVSRADLLGASSTNEIHITTPQGHLYITGYDPATGEVSWRYEPYNWGNPDNPHSWQHGVGQGEAANVYDTFEVVVKDADGQSANGDMSVRIKDTIPEAHDDIDYVSGSHGTANGNVITGGGGADTIHGDHSWLDGVTSGRGVDPDPNEGFSAGHSDGSGGNHGDQATVLGQYGTLTIDRDGNYTYTLNPGVTGEHDDIFTYRLVDSDGSYSDATLTININHGTHVYNGSSPVAGSEGVTDTLLLASDLMSGDIRNLHNSNIDRIDLLAKGDAHKVEGLTLADVLNINENNALTILGGNKDSVSLAGDGWVKSDTGVSGTGLDTGHLFDVYTNINDASVRVMIEHNVDQHIISS